MERIGDLLNVDNLSIAREEKKEQLTINPLSVRLVEYVFAKFFTLCRGCDVLYADPKRLKIEKAQWQATFSRENYTTIDHIRKALLKLERHSYPNPPQLGEFLKWNESSPDDLGLMSKEQAYNKAFVMMRDGDPKDLSADQIMLIRKAIQKSDSYFLKNNSHSKTQPIFYRNYEILVRDFLVGKIRSVQKGIEDKHDETIELKKQKDACKEFKQLKGYKNSMSQIHKILGMNTDESTNDRRMQKDT